MEPNDLRAQQTTFAFLWALAHLTHIWHQGGAGGVGDPMQDLWLTVPLVPSLLVLARPTSLVRLVLLATSQLVAFAIQMPLVANHWTMAAFVNAAIVLIAARWKWSGDTQNPFADIVSTARLVFLVSYGAAAIAKLNTGFLDPDRSCAVELVVVAGLDPWRITWLPAAIIGLTIAIEIAIPVLLLNRRTQLVGIALAGGFHLLIALPPSIWVMDYSLFVFALVFLFAPIDAGARAVQSMQAASREGTLLHLIRRGRFARWLLAAMVIVLAIGRGGVLPGPLWGYVTWTLFVLCGTFVVATGLVILAGYRQAERSARTSPQPTQLRGMAPILLIAVLLNAGSPHLGGKTTSSFTMFSNLRTEGGASNHLLIPRAPWDSPQDDLVRLINSSNEQLQVAADEDVLLTRHEVRRTLSDDPQASITFERDGAVVELQRADAEPAFAPLPWWSQKLLHFRPVNIAGSPICQP